MLKVTTLRIVLVIVVVVLLFGIGLTLLATRPGDASVSCAAYYAAMENPPAAAYEWCQAGAYFSWESTLPVNADFEALNIFHICQGNPENPAILMIHGYPTMSFDYAPLFDALKNDFYVCALDTPGYGFSDKPLGGYDYSLDDDARLVDEYIREIAGLDEFTLLTHDKGDSVGLALLQIYQTYDEKPYRINHHFITNGNIYLPLAQLTTGQKVLLNPISGPLISALITGTRMADGLAELAYASTLPQSEIDSLASIFDYRDGLAVSHEIIEYLNERAENEVGWLEALAKSEIPTTLIWGEQDEIAPVSVPDFVWENYLADRETPVAYWRIPCANHYLQVDTPELIVDIIRTTLAEGDVPFEIDGTLCQAVKIY
jgi:pimeloyl-ACP methyl ester carboxylesterase